MKKARRFPGVVTRAIAVALLIALVSLCVYALYVAAGMRAHAQVSGTVRAHGLTAPVRIVRDGRGIPHIYAANDHDLFFAQGYAQASDRLFQMDLLRRYVRGTLAEVLGSAVLPADENARIPDIEAIVDAQWRALDPHERMLVSAFSDGVNAAMREQPLPVEFRLLLYKPQPWKPQDSLAAGMATVLDLIDPWGDVIRRDAVSRASHAPPAQDSYSITDPAYDSPITTGDPAPVPRLDARSAPSTGSRPAAFVERPPTGSNEWAAGAAHTTTGRAILANDPHLRLGIPGVWWLVDLRAPGIHVAGASLAGTPGVILGHNEHIAWAATNGTVATESVYRDPLAGARVRRETFHVRFGHDVVSTYYRTVHGFVAQTDGKTGYAVDWNALTHPVSPISAFEHLDRANSVAAALDALRLYPGPPQNFAIADTSGAAAYHLAGLIPRDPAWGLRVHASSDPLYPFVGFDALPHVPASRKALVFTANNRMYGAGYAYRLSPNFAAPYRAHRIEQLLASKPRLGVGDMAAFQLDTLSLPERDIAAETVLAARRTRADRDPALAPYVTLLAHWNGRFDPDTRGAALAWELRRTAAEKLAAYTFGRLQSAYQGSADTADVVLLMRVLRERPRGWWPHDDYAALLVESLRDAVKRHGPRMMQPWGDYARLTVRHPLASLGLTFLNGASFPGDGDSYSLHVQTDNHSQSFRAVWDVGNWDAGGISIPSGESGEPGSGHYTDLSGAWIGERLEPLPFSEGAVRAAARQTLTLSP